MYGEGGSMRAATAILVATALTAAVALLAAAAVPTGPGTTPAHLEYPPAGPAGVAASAASALDVAPAAPAPSLAAPPPSPAAPPPSPAAPPPDPAAAPQDPAAPPPSPAAPPPSPAAPPQDPAAPPQDPAAPPQDPAAPPPSPAAPPPDPAAATPSPAAPPPDPAAPPQYPAAPPTSPAASPSPPPPPAAAPDPVLAELAALMSGSYSSAAQAAADPQNYRDIRLVMVPIWKDRADGPWLYVEQAAATSLEKPYRQRVYQLVRTGPETIESRVYTLPDPALRFAGAADDPGKLAGLAPDALALRSGCAVVLKKSGPVWTGSTAGKECGSDLRGASYATSEVSLDLSTLESWDRGFDADGKQVWGAEKGPYIFTRE